MQAHRSIVSSAVATRGHPTPTAPMGQRQRAGTKEDLATVAWELQKALAHAPLQVRHVARAAAVAPRIIDPNRPHAHTGTGTGTTTAKAHIDDVKFKVKVTPEYTETTLRISNGHATATHGQVPTARTRAHRTTDKPNIYAAQLQQSKQFDIAPPAPAAALNYRSLMSRGHIGEPADHNIRAWISQSSTSLSSAGGKATGHESLPATPQGNSRSSTQTSTVKDHSSSDGSKGSRGGGEIQRGSGGAASSRTSSGSGSKRSSTYISAPGNPERLTLISSSKGHPITLPPVVVVPAHRPIVTTAAKNERSVVGSIDVTSSYAASKTSGTSPARETATIIAARDSPGSKHTGVHITPARSTARGSGEAREDDTEITIDLMAIGQPQIKIWPFDSFEHYQQFMDAHPDAANAHFNVRPVDSVPSLGRHESSSIDAHLASAGGRDQRARCETVHSGSGTSSLASSQVLHMNLTPASAVGDKTSEHINHHRLTRAQAPASSKGSSDSLASAQKRHSTTSTRSARTSRSSDSVASGITDQSSIYARPGDEFVAAYSPSTIYKIADAFDPNDSGFDRIAYEHRLHQRLIAEEQERALAISVARQADEEERTLQSTESDAAIAELLHQEEIEQANQAPTSYGAVYRHDLEMAARYPSLYERQEREYERQASIRRNAAMRFDQYHLHPAAATATASPSAASDRTVMPDMTPRPGDFKNRTGVRVRAPTPHPRGMAAPDLNRPLPDTPASATVIEEASEWSWSDDILEIDEARRAISVYSDRTWPPKPRKTEGVV